MEKLNLLQFILIQQQQQQQKKQTNKKKIVVHLRFRLENYFQEILHLINVWINEGSGWIVESIASQYINILTY